jgi:hypothetical protein
VVQLTHDKMCRAETLKAPLEVEVEVGQNWLDMEKAEL